MKYKVAIVRGKFLNRYEMQFFEPLVKDFDITAFGSLTPYHESFVFPVEKLPSPMDLPDFPYKMPILNRMFTDAHYLLGLEEKLAGFDLVHTAETYYHYTNQALDAKKKGYVKKVITTVLENIPFHNEGIRGRKEWKERSRNELDHIIALTEKTKQALLMEGCDPCKITVISHYIDTKRFHPSERLGESEPLTILFVGRFEPEKGVLDVLSASERLLSDRELRKHPFRFLLVGDGSKTGDVQSFIRRHGFSGKVSVEHKGYEDMPGVYEQADIFIAPSKPTETWEEQYNTSLLEAQAGGLAIVTTRTGGIPENVGEAGVIVEPGNVMEMTQALKRFIIDRTVRESYQKKARQRALTHHDRAIGAVKLKELYFRVLSGS